MEVKENLDLRDKRELWEAWGELEALEKDMKYMSSKTVITELYTIMAPVEALLNNRKYNEEDFKSCETVLLRIFRMSAKIKKRIELRPATLFLKWCSRAWKVIKAWFSNFVEGFKVLGEVLSRCGAFRGAR